MQIKASTAESIAVLILSPCEDTRASLLEICAGQHFTVYEATDLRQAVTLFHRHAPPVVICNSDWRDFLDMASGCERTCVIVTGPFADEALWAEVLNRGGFDVLAQPLDSNEVIRSIQAAFRRSKTTSYHPSVFAVSALAAG